MNQRREENKKEVKALIDKLIELLKGEVDNFKIIPYFKRSKEIEAVVRTKELNFSSKSKD